MCGIFGVTVGEHCLTTGKLPCLIDDLFLLSESRGKEASGIAVCGDHSIQVLKSAVAASSMIRSKQYRKLIVEAMSKNLNEPLTIIGHSRLVTDGSRYHQGNNQPVLASD